MTTRYSIYLGDTLRRLRQDARLSLRDVSARAFVSLGYLSEVETSRKNPAPEVLERLCGVYGITHSALLRRVADTMDLFAEDVLHWADENSMSADRLPARPLAR